jgi:phosphatidylglycerophosphatase A
VKRRLALAIATAAGSGYWPWGPGTAGSLVAVAAFHLGVPALAGAMVGLLPAIWASAETARISGRKDPQIVVIDEVIGQWVALTITIRGDWKSTLAAFVLFRLFDITKPWPVRRLELLPGGWGIVMDDVAAGVYALFVLLALRWFNLIS